MEMLDKQVSLKLRRIEYEQIMDIINTNKELYDDISHFIRCAIIKQIRNYRVVE